MAIQSSQIALKASFYTITVLKLPRDSSVMLLESMLQQWVCEAPQLFQGMPVVVDLSDTHQSACPLPSVIACLRHHGLTPVGIQGADLGQQELARALHIAIFSPRTASSVRDTTPQATKNLVIEPTIVETVRSGQQIQVKGDLIILGSVSPGAEVSAEGSIHVYGSLGGRALAGIHDNPKALIFCHSMQAELVAIAGYYWQYEDVRAASSAKGICVYLEGDTLKTRALG